MPEFNGRGLIDTGIAGIGELQTFYEPIIAKSLRVVLGEAARATGLTTNMDATSVFVVFYDAANGLVGITTPHPTHEGLTWEGEADPVQGLKDAEAQAQQNQ